MKNRKYSNLAVSHIVPFMAAWVVFLFVGLVIITAFPHGSFFLWINEKHSDFWDLFFKFFTAIGDGEYFGYLLIPLGLWKLKYALTGLTGYLAGGIIVQVLKYLFDKPRPLGYFEGMQLNLVEGIDVHSHLSFPSGHTASGFAIFLFFAIISKSRLLSFVFFLCALSVGVSRVYLVQHFFEDIYIGSIIGVVGMLWIYMLWERNEKISGSAWYNYSVIKQILSLSSKPS